MEKQYEIVVRCRVTATFPAGREAPTPEEVAEYMLAEPPMAVKEDLELVPTGATLVSARVVGEMAPEVKEGYSVRFYTSKDSDELGGKLTQPFRMAANNDINLERARVQAELEGEKLVVDPRTDFPSFVVYRDGAEIGGG